MKSIIIFIIFCTSIVFADRNLEVMPSLSENTYSGSQKKMKKTNKKIIEIQDNINSRVHKNISADRKAQIKAKLKSLNKRINSKRHALKLKYQAKKNIIKKNKNIKRNKQIKKSKQMLKKLRGISIN